MVVQITSTYAWYQVMIGRLVAGFGVGALSLLVPMYQAETAPRHVRGALISAYQLFITFGIFLAAVFNYAAERHQSGKAASWQITMGLSFVFAVILGGGMLLFNETPRFDYRKGKIDRAKRTMMRVYGVGENHYSIYKELEEIKRKLEEETVRGNAVQEWFRMWKAPKMAHRLILGMGLQMFQQLTGYV
jgi:MFS family permease